ncbi:MAG: START domain-containing protein, partial [Myxococcota bacterium]
YTTDEVVAILSDIERYKEFMPNTIESTVIERKALSEQREIALIYQRLDLPTISDRDFIVKADTRRRKSSAGNFWTIDFKPNNDRRAPNPQDDVVRVTVVSGKWLLTPIQGGKATHLTAIRHMELGGSIPAFMVNSGLRDGLHETLVKLRDRCKTLMP